MWKYIWDWRIFDAIDTENLHSATNETTEQSSQQANSTETNTESNVDQQEQDPNTNQNQQQQPVTYKYSLRQWFYDLVADDDTSMVHAVYSTNNPLEIMVLCEYRKRFSVLEILHNLVEHITQLFPAEAMSTYFPQESTTPFAVKISQK